MSEQNKKMVEAITAQEVDFAQWYTDICTKAELVEYSSVKGFVVLRPYGYAIWENIQRDLDDRFKATGHQNVAMPMLMPESLLKKEGELVDGFAPEVAWVTMGGSEQLEERLAVRPTSETLFCDHFSHVLHSWRDLPMLYNQWCSVVRWEKTTRPFLRTREFWWQEGHTIHETAEEAIAETEQQLACYADFCERDLCIPVLKGRKTDKEKFAGADATYTIEAMMKDGKALQSGTSHYFGDKFSRAYDVTFAGRDNTLRHPFQTSWGTSTRLIGAIIMTHGDDDGLILPPAIAPIQLVVVPVAAHKPGVLEKARELKERLGKQFKVHLDDSDNSPGWKFSQYEMKGVPLRLEIGPKDIEKGQCVLVRRDTREKYFVPLADLETEISRLLQELAQNLYNRALENREKRTWSATTMEQVKQLSAEHTGFIKTMWCGDLACEEKMKEEAGLSSRCMPFEQEALSDVCPCCGRPAKTMVVWGKAY
ncbi:MAG: proline--tRNA ligase [Pygmaiobacter massiliensis]|nr:proline--tRNA ligase [Pygmaiobacter massiliensis]